MVRKLASIGIAVVLVWLLMIQADALSGYQPRFGVWAGEYLADIQILKNWQENGVLPDRDDISDSPQMQYNYATMLAQHGEVVELPEAVSYWEQSIAQYEALLKQEVNEYAQHNKLLLEQLLEQEQQDAQQDQQDQSASGEEGSEEQGAQQEGSQGGGEEGSQEQQNSQSAGEQQGSQGESPQESGLSEQQLQQLQDYQEQLQQQQFQNQQYFGKQQQNQQPQSILDQFFGDPQFRQGGVGEERDW